MDTETLDRIIRNLHDKGAVHRKGFRLNNLTSTEVVSHLQDEILELNAADTYKEQCDEAGDVLACMLHLFYVLGLPLPVVLEVAQNKLTLRFTEEPEQTTESTWHWPKYHAKPCEIEAIEYTPENRDEIILRTGASFRLTQFASRHKLFLQTPEGELEARPGHFVVRGTEGEFYPVMPSVMARKYEAGPLAVSESVTVEDVIAAARKRWPEHKTVQVRITVHHNGERLYVLEAWDHFGKRIELGDDMLEETLTALLAKIEGEA